MWSMCNAAERPGSGHDIGTIRHGRDSAKHAEDNQIRRFHSISGLVVEYIIAIDVTRVRFPADAFFAEEITNTKSPIVGRFIWILEISPIP